MFHYVLQYPLMIKEAAKLSKKGAGVHITLGLKKVLYTLEKQNCMQYSALLQVCQFLTRFSHAFSSYYSRTKVLMVSQLPLEHQLFIGDASVPRVSPATTHSRQTVSNDDNQTSDAQWTDIVSNRTSGTTLGQVLLQHYCIIMVVLRAAIEILKFI